jgi:hypothetical protein
MIRKTGILPKAVLLLIAWGWITGALDNSPTFKIAVRDGKTRSVEVPQQDFAAALDHGGKVSKVRIKPSPVTAFLDGKGKLLQASGPGKISHDSSGRISRIGKIDFLYDSSGRISRIGQMDLYYDSSQRINRVGHEDFYYDSSGRISRIGSVDFLYDSSQRYNRIGGVDFFYNSSQKITRIGRVDFSYDGQGRFTGTTGDDPAVSIDAG